MKTINLIGIKQRKKTRNAVILILLILCFVVLRANGQDRDSIPEIRQKTMPIQITFIYPMGTNGLSATRIPNNVSLNILAGMSGGVKGLELGGLANFSAGDIIGVQAAGLANGSLGIIKGVQLSGLASYNKGYVVGLQASGLANVNTDSLAGVQLAGLVNVTTHNMSGFMASGISNTTVGDFRGAQFSGIINVTTQQLNGVQVGLMNYARNVNGFQLGLVNVAHSAEKGAALGLFTYIRTGYHRFEIESNETFYLNTTFKSGVNRLYTIYTVGFKTSGDKVFWAPGIGLGTMFPLSQKVNMNVDLMARQVNEDAWWTEDLNLLNTLKMNFSYKIKERLEFYGGPTLNVVVSGIEDSEGNIVGESFAPSWYFFSKTYGNNQVKMYMGLNAGIRF